MKEKNNHNLIYNLFKTNEENSSTIKTYWEEGDLLTHRLYCSFSEKIFHNFKR